VAANDCAKNIVMCNAAISVHRQGLAMWRYSVLSKPGLMLSKDMKMKIYSIAGALFVRLICRQVAIYRWGYIRKADIPPSPMLAVRAFR
jgi:hypothetical protein